MRADFENRIKTIAVIICIVLITSAFSSAIAILSRSSGINNYEDVTSSDHVSVMYSFERPMMEQVLINDTLYDRIIMDGAPCSGNPGEPSLPAKGAYILLPQGSAVKDIVVTPGEKIFLGSGFIVEPVREPVPMSQISSAPLPTPDEAVYSSQDLFPGNLFTLVGTHGFRGYEILVLMLHPVQYLPVTGELFYYENIKITVKTIQEDDKNPLFRGLEKDRLEAIKKVDNPHVIETYRSQERSVGSLDDYDLLIITTDELKDGFVPLKNVHDVEGVTTTIKTLTDIGSNPTEIRNFIRNEYINHNISYVLIAGDDDVVPARQLMVRMEPDHPMIQFMPSDLYYACLDGPYNYDGDNKWGEPNDGENGGDVDLEAEVYLGRACVGSTTEVEHFVDKTIAYIYASDNYLARAVMVGERLYPNPLTWGGDYMDELINGTSAHGYTTVGFSSNEFYNTSTLYDRDWPGYNWPKSEIIGHINNGTHIINHIGHSSPGDSMNMNITDVISLTNNLHCFIYSQGCESGAFDDPYNDFDCIAEQFTVKTSYGAFAGIWNAREGMGVRGSTDGPSQRYHREFWDAVLGENITVISMANQDSKEDNLYRINEFFMRWGYYQLNLFGDPTLAFYINSPETPHLEIEEIKGGIGEVKAVIANIGEANAANVEYFIAVTGGILEGIYKRKSETIPTLLVNAKETVRLGMIFGLGRISVNVTVEAENAEKIKKDAAGFVFGPFVFITS